VVRVRPILVLYSVVAIYLLLPIVAIVLYSVATSWTAHALPDGYTMAQWSRALVEPRMRGALQRTFALAILVLFLDFAVVVPAVYWQRVRNPRIRIVTELSAAIPFVLPFVVIAFGILRLYGIVAPQMLGTPWLLLLGHAAIAFPFLYWAIDGAMAAIDVVRLNEAAQVCGASPRQTLRYVVIPNIGPGIATGGMLVFATSFGEFALAQLLVGARFETVSVYSLDLLNRTNSDFPLLAVLTTLTIVILFVVSMMVVRLNSGQDNRMLPAAQAPEIRR
jgi:putative spermidine/putrescine transport system permease protein